MWKAILGLTLAISLLGALGCSDKTNADLKEGANNAAETTKEKVNEGAAAISLTPDIKAAIVANPKLNEDGNLVDVDTTPQTVTLKGHVKSQELKSLAEDLAKTVMKKQNATQTLVNELEIKA